MRKFLTYGAGLAVVAVLYFAVFSGDDEKYIVTVKFSDAGGILNNYKVKIGQVGAGDVKDISLDKDDNAVITLELDQGAYPIGAGATAKVRPVNLLGEKYIDLDPGDLSKPVESGTTIPVAKTSVPVELDDALNILDPDTRGAMRIIINEAGLTMAGRGADFNRTLDDLPPALDVAEKVVSEADAENARLQQLITQGDRVLQAINPKSDDLGDLVASAGDALETAAQRRANLGRTIQGAPGALGQLRTTLVRLEDATVQLAPAADDLLATAPSLATTLDRVPAFAKDAKETLKEVERVSPQLDKLGRRTTPTLKVLQPTLGRLSAFTGDLQPLLDSLDQDDGLKGLLGFINGWAGVTDSGDPIGKVFRLRATVDSQALSTALDRLPGSAAKKKAGRKKAAPAPQFKPAPQPSTTPSAPAPSRPGLGSKVPKLPPVVDKLLPGVQKTVDDATKALDNVIGGATKKILPPTPPRSSASDASKLLNYLLGS
ncbi:MAG: MCE family protein [Solirubrobacterales bacterium]|nr:MCE family protein [Solirubrobacterales bacterium]